MRNAYNLKLYRLYAPAYDHLFGIYDRARRRAVDLLDVQAGEQVLVTGIGTGLDLPALPSAAHITGIDLSAAMLAQAERKAAGRAVSLAVMDAQHLEFPDACFDAAVLNLILSVVPDGRAAFRETWRVLRPGGRAVIFDKFLPEDERLSPLRRIIGAAVRLIGTDPNRRLSELIGGVSGLIVVCDEPSLLRGQYRIVLLRKQA